MRPGNTIQIDALAAPRSVVTPNSFEAELLTGRHVSDTASALAACDALHDMGPHTVVRSRDELGVCVSCLTVAFLLTIAV